MRSVAALLAVLTACGSDSSSRFDAAPQADGSNVNAATGDPSDAAAEPDAGGDQPVSMVWIVGDFLTNDRRQAGGFPSDSALPIDPDARASVVIPGAEAELYDGSGATEAVFDARGGRIAYVANQTTPGQFDLYVANADGSGSTLLVAGQALVEITSVALSPDGSKVAFAMDAAVDGGYDLHLVPAAGGTPVKLSPDRPGDAPTPSNMDVFYQYEWSADSDYLAFSADLVEDGFDQAFLVDTTAETPEALQLLTRGEIETQASGAQGVRGRLRFDGANNVYFRARVSTANNGAFSFFKSDTAGEKAAITPPARGDRSVSDVGAFGITPDGSTLVFSADAPSLGTYNLFAQAVVDPQEPINLTDVTPIRGATLRADFTSPLVFAPDSSGVAVIANFLSGAATEMEPFVIALDGTGMRRLFEIAGEGTNSDAERLAWTGQGLFVQGDLAINNDTRVFRFDPDTADQSLTLAVDGPTDGDIQQLFATGP